MFIYFLLLGHVYISLVIGGSPIFCISPTIQNEIQSPKLYFTRVSRFRALSLLSLKGKSCTGDFRINPLIWREECSHKYIFRLMRWIEAVTSLLNVEISLKCVTTGHLPSAPLPIIIREALALKNTLSGIDPELTPTWTCSLPLVRTWTNQAGMSKALSDKPSHPNNFATLYCPVYGVCFSRR